MTTWTTNAVKRSVTASDETDARWISDWTIRAPSSTGASGSVMAAWPATTATSIRPPKIGSPSMQFACARASRCMNGDRVEFAGSKPLAGTALVSTSRARIASIRTSSSKRPCDESRQGPQVRLMLAPPVSRVARQSGISASTSCASSVSDSCQPR